MKHRYPDKRPPVADDRVRMMQQLYMCTPQILKLLDVTTLRQRYPRLPAKEVEYQLTIALQKRAAEL